MEALPPEVTLGGSASAVFFMIVSLPADAADTICCSMVLFILAVNDCLMEACLTRAVFLGGMYRFPFFGLAAALAACLDDEALF